MSLGHAELEAGLEGRGHQVLERRGHSARLRIHDEVGPEHFEAKASSWGRLCGGAGPLYVCLAKAFLAQGLAHGFDMATPEGIQAWMETYNAGLAGVGAERPLALPRARASRASKPTVARRKLAQQSRRTNRKKRSGMS